MIRLTADDAVLAVLSQAKELAEIRDRSGKVIGFFAPAALEHALMCADVVARTDFAEIERRKQNKAESRTTGEVFEHLRSLTQDEKMRAYLQEKIDGLKERDRCPTP